MQGLGSGVALEGVVQAMVFLTQQNRRVAGDLVPDRGAVLATGRRVVVLGGGVSEALGKPYLERVEESVRRHVFPSALAPKVNLRLTKLKDDAGVLGAAMLAWQALG